MSQNKLALRRENVPWFQSVNFKNSNYVEQMQRAKRQKKRVKVDVTKSVYSVPGECSTAAASPTSELVIVLR